METILPCICIQATRKRNPKCSLSHTFLCRCLSWKNVVLAGVYIHMWIRFSPPLGSRTKIGLGRKTILREYSKRRTNYRAEGFFVCFSGNVYQSQSMLTN